MRRVSLLAAASAGLSVGVLVLAGIAAGAMSGRPAVAGVLLVAAIVAGVGLVIGWRPGLALSSIVALVGGVVLTGAPVAWVGLGLVGAAVVVSHEAARVSLDLRRPARLGPGVLSGLARRTALLAATSAVVAAVGAAVADRRPPGWLVVVALVGAAVPMAAPAGGARLAGAGAGGIGGSGAGTGGDRARAGAALALTAVVLACALVGAAARQQLPAGTAGSGGGRALVNDAEPAAAPAPTIAPADDNRAPGRRLGGSLVDLILLALGAAVVALLVAGLRRSQIPLDTEPVDLGPDDPGLDLVAAQGAELDDEVVTLDDDVAAAVIAEITVDLRSEPDPGRAVRYAYARVERRLGTEGVERRVSESEPEFLARAMTVLGDDGGAMEDLTALFERARFSDAPVPEDMRADALAALERLRRRLEAAR